MGTKVADILKNEHAEGVEHDAENEAEADVEPVDGAETEGAEGADGGTDTENGDGAGEDAGDGTGAEGVEGEEGAEGAEAEGQGIEARLAAIEAENKALKEQLTNPKDDEKKDEGHKPRDPQEVTRMAEDFGCSEKLITHLDSVVTTIIDSVKGYMDNTLSTKLADTEFGGIIEKFAKDPKFANIKSFDKDIKAFLKENAHPSKWSDPKMMNIAYTFAKGLNSDKKVKKAINTRELNRKVSKAPASKSASSKVVSGKKYPALSPQDDKIRRQSGMSIQEWHDMDTKSVSELMQ